MKAICVTETRGLELRDIPTPTEPPAGHILVDMAGSAINHGDKAFLAQPMAAGAALTAGRHDVWGASGAGRVVALGAGVPAEYAGKQVALYRSLRRSPDGIGLWSARAQIPYESCLILPDAVEALDYCGSLVNVITAYAFLQTIAAAGDRGVIVTAGNSATGHALAALARRRNVPAIFLARSAAGQEALKRLGVAEVISTAEEGFEAKLGARAAALGTTAVFDGVGGALTSRIAPHLPMNSTIYFYGFLGGAEPIALPSLLFMAKNLVLRRFSNFESATVKDSQALVAALKDLEGAIEDPMFRTRIGQVFRFDQIDQAMGYEAKPGAKAVLIPG